MVWPVLSLQEDFNHFSYKKTNLIWSDPALFSFRRIWTKKKSSNFLFWSKQIFWSKGNTAWSILSFTIILMVFTNFLFGSICVFCAFYQILFKRQYGLTSAIVSFREFWIFLILKLNFSIAYYSATFLCPTLFVGTAARNFWKQRCESNCITSLDSFLKFYHVT